jgi:hypothetical protein
MPPSEPKSLGADFARPVKRAIRHDYQPVRSHRPPLLLIFKKYAPSLGLAGSLIALRWMN